MYLRQLSHINVVQVPGLQHDNNAEDKNIIINGYKNRYLVILYLCVFNSYLLLHLCLFIM